MNREKGNARQEHGKDKDKDNGQPHNKWKGRGAAETKRQEQNSTNTRQIIKNAWVEQKARGRKKKGQA